MEHCLFVYLVPQIQEAENVVQPLSSEGSPLVIVEIDCTSVQFLVRATGDQGITGNQGRAVLSFITRRHECVILQELEIQPVLHSEASLITHQIVEQVCAQRVAYDIVPEWLIPRLMK